MNDILFANHVRLFTATLHYRCVYLEHRFPKNMSECLYIPPDEYCPRESKSWSRMLFMYRRCDRFPLKNSSMTCLILESGESLVTYPINSNLHNRNGGFSVQVDVIKRVFTLIYLVVY